MDAEGYPEEYELQKIEKWDCNEVIALIDFIYERWTYRAGYFVKKWGKDRLHKRPVIFLELHTAGWSGNEDMINALIKNTMFPTLWYQKWERGGHYYFEINPYNIGYRTVAEYCKDESISRQAVHKSKEKYDWIETSTLKLCKPKPSLQP